MHVSMQHVKSSSNLDLGEQWSLKFKKMKLEFHRDEEIELILIHNIEFFESVQIRNSERVHK